MKEHFYMYDPDNSYGEGLSTVLKTSKCSVFSNTVEMIDKFPKEKPDAILVDIMDNISGHIVVSQIREKCKKVLVLGLINGNPPFEALTMIKAGANGIAFKNDLEFTVRIIRNHFKARIAILKRKVHHIT